MSKPPPGSIRVGTSIVVAQYIVTYCPRKDKAGHCWIFVVGDDFGDGGLEYPGAMEQLEQAICDAMESANVERKLATMRSKYSQLCAAADDACCLWDDMPPDSEDVFDDAMATLRETMEAQSDAQPAQDG